MSESAFILDGQHRLAGLENRDVQKPAFEVNVSIFVGAGIADQAEIFSRVNLAQTKVNKSPAYDLLDYAKETSPHKVAHDVAVALNRDPEGPFFKKIKRLGIRTPSVETETLAQATVVNGFLRHLPKDQEKERSKGILGWVGKAEPQENWKDRIFLEFYRADDTLPILETVSNYFEAVRDRWEQAWDTPEKGQILCRTTGFNALIRFLKDAYISVVSNPRIVEKDEFAKIFEEMKLRDKDFTKEKFIPGSTGASALYHEFKSVLDRMSSDD